MKSLPLAILIAAVILVPVGMVLGYLPLDMTGLLLLGSMPRANASSSR